MQDNTEQISGISERILQVVESFRVSKNKFGKDLGYDPAQTIYDLINGKSNPSYDFFDRFVNSEYSETINVEWLISGKGEMHKEKEGESDSKIMSIHDRLLKIIESQQRTIESQQETFKHFVQKNDTAETV